ncbi:hypothetical protein [Streptomyces sp. NPDC048489]|uniref:hypothetical protein n=1 Tax=Streptomyces sp. NPDC048489 TaxID=3154504 RepID=UPI003449BD24
MTSTATATPLRYTCELALTDVDALEAFFRTNIGEVQQHHDVHTAENRAARSLQSMLGRRFEQLRQAFLYDDGSREVLQVKDRHWSELCLTAIPWREHPAFDTARWRSTQHLNAEHEVEMAAYRRSMLR